MPESKIIEGYRYLDVLTSHSVSHGEETIYDLPKVHEKACTISFELDTGAKHLNLGFAFRNPIDQMNRKRGRQISRGRRRCSRTQLSVDLEEGETIKKAAARVLGDGMVRFPLWMFSSDPTACVHSEFS